VSLGGTATLATIRLSSGVPSSFRLGVLEDNASGIQFFQGSVSVDGANSITKPVPGNGVNGFNPEDDFFFFNITNAAPGDELTISATNDGGGPPAPSFATLGGITFDTLPEPATLGVLGVTAVGLMLRRTRTSK
jgi:hypothetical protein